MTDNVVASTCGVGPRHLVSHVLFQVLPHVFSHALSHLVYRLNTDSISFHRTILCLMCRRCQLWCHANDMGGVIEHHGMTTFSISLDYDPRG